MTSVVLIKIISEASNGYHGLFMVMDEKDDRYNKKIHLFGNFPSVPYGVTMGVEYKWDCERKKGLISDYEIYYSERNLRIFSKVEGFDVETFKAKVAFHKVMGILWRKIDKTFDDPYARYSFQKADKIFKKTNKPADSKVRLNALIKETIARSRKYRKDRFTIEEFLTYIARIERYGAFDPLPVTTKMSLLESDAFAYENGEIVDVEIQNAQQYIERSLIFRKRVKEELLSEEEINNAVTEGLDEEQIHAIHSLRYTTPSIVTGGAGVGKTTVVTTIINCFNQVRPLSEILLLAPTGRASRRLYDVTGWKASTIHKALCLIPKEDGCEEFQKYSEHNKLPHDLVIVDESSMIDTLLMAQLLKAVKEETKIIFVGDHQQLFPVGVGEPFFDFMNNECCDVFHLVHNHRQGKNDIEKNANLALQDKPFEAGSGVKIANVPWRYIPTLLHKIEQANGALASPSQMQIMSPFNRMNRKINEILRKHPEENKRFAVNDKIIAIRNTDDYCNGDVGFVTGVPERGLEVQFEDGRRIYIEQSNLDDIQLAYSITVHKMQGSECKRIYLFLPKNKGEFIGKRLLYTAVTRAKEELFIYYYDEEEAKLRPEDVKRLAG